ncbi:hypothetical protein [Solicola gregarius]|uniref:Uncharacterized protein n=1 Tax=Solicola gregarius TaxID=2908642 RepID=A0AA46YKF6_9ACTN|nr:hypothetical protein [Solicola gregarius]UYM03928.1 hypothetical protein L0C25_15415 [Solicola gregarius]
MPKNRLVLGVVPVAAAALAAGLLAPASNADAPPATEREHQGDRLSRLVG